MTLRLAKDARSGQAHRLVVSEPKASRTRSDITGVILAGGKSRRFGSNKALARIGDGGFVIERIAHVLKDIFEEILVLTKDKTSFSFLEKPWLHVLNDRSPDFHPLNGLASAFSYSKTEMVFVCGCDMPFINSDLIHLICSKSQEADATVPIWQGQVQPLFGVYSKKCLAVINGLSLSTDPRKGFRYLLSEVNTQTIDQKELPESDPAELTFFDIDTPEEFKIAKKILSKSSFPRRRESSQWLDPRLRGGDELEKGLC
jgi:molybdopterin-guanine dinucleotide biosynthesis protein A